MCQTCARQYGFSTIPLMPTNLYGPSDNFDLETAHVIPALMRKFHEGKAAGDESVTGWGSGSPRREFLYLDDLADAARFFMESYHALDIINVGVGEDLTIADLAALMRDIVGCEGEAVFDRNRPDGTPRKVLNVSRCNQPSGLAGTYQLGRWPAVDLYLVL